MPKARWWSACSARSARRGPDDDTMVHQILKEMS